MNTKNCKPTYKTLRVKLDDGQEVSIKRCTLENTQSLLELQDELIEIYVRCNGSIGEVIADENVREKLTAICNLLPIVSNKEQVEYLDFEKIQEGWEQLVILFFNGSLDESRQLTDVTSPSQVSELHFFPYVKMMQKYVNQISEEKDSKKGKN